MARKPKFKKPPELKFPLLRCPVCGYEYRPKMHGWAFRTSRDTVCVGLNSDEAHTYGHPFVVIKEE